MRGFKFPSGALLALIVGLGLSGLSLVPGPAIAADGAGRETIIFVRHGEKPKAGLGQLDCQGLNRALALPKVIETQFGRPAAVFAPDPARRKDDEGTPYDYVRPLATVEPAAVRFGLPVDTRYGFAEIAQLREALEQPSLHEAIVLVGWEHKIIDVVAKLILSAHGGSENQVPVWASDDFDSIYIVRIDWSPSGSSATFEHGHEGLDGLSTICPG